MRRFRLSYPGPLSSFHGVDDDDNNDNNNNVKGDVNLKRSLISVFKQRHLSSTALSSSHAPLTGDVDVVPDISRLDFRRSSTRSCSPHGCITRPSTASETREQPVWRLSGAGSRIPGLVPRSVVGGFTRHTASVIQQTSDREWRIALPAAVVACCAAALLLTLFFVWMRRRRCELLTASKL